MKTSTKVTVLSVVVTQSALTVWAVIHLSRQRSLTAEQQLIKRAEFLNSFFREEAKKWLCPSPQALKKKVRTGSHYLEPIPRDGRPHGLSRAWGHVTDDVRRAMILTVLRRAKECGYDALTTDFLVCQIFAESGFNPDAAAPESSAAGLLQLIDRTRRTWAARLDIPCRDIFSVDFAMAVMPHLLEEAKSVVTKEYKRNPRPDWSFSELGYYARLYGYHHDGPSFSSGGTQIGREKIAVWMTAIREDSRR